MSDTSVGKKRKWLAKFSKDYKLAPTAKRKRKQRAKGLPAYVGKATAAPNVGQGDNAAALERRREQDKTRHSDSILSREMMKHRTRDSGANKIVGARVFKFGTDRTEFPRKSYGPWSNNSRKKERKLTNAEVMSKKMKQSMGTRQQAPDSVDQQ